MKKGFTLFEIVITMALFAILTGVGLIILNPGGQLASARNDTRKNHLLSLKLAITQNIADQGDQTFSCASGSLPTTTKRMMSAAGGYNIAPCLMDPPYLQSMPYDPATSSAHFVSVTDYDTGYAISQNASTSQITLTAPAAELGKSITFTF